ncbi:SUMO-interacting motif-containing protein 1 isoform X2 [Simochromis diagramma]|uniref:SUMO-interacting motif-containing protein 1 isoform X2 n=1 Tax=Simochromis diagramma TaxID=43689 RepID=UPI001A7ED2CE|nr:SUMO-interacting motif-containing protein 1 isoform X2 [Simochromis diagramma]
MDDVISLSSDDSDVEIVGSYCTFTAKPDPMPLSAVRVEVDAVKLALPPNYIDLTDPRWTLPELRRRQNGTGTALVDLTENETEQETENLPPDDCQSKNTNTNTNLNHFSQSQDFNNQKTPLTDSVVCAPQQDCGDPKPKQRRLNPQIPETQHPKKDNKAAPCPNTPAVKLKRLPFLETHVAELKTSKCSVYVTKDCTQMSLNSHGEAPRCNSNLSTTTTPNVSNVGPFFDVSPPKDGQENNSEECTNTQVQDDEPQHLHSPADSPRSVGENSVASSKEHSIHDGPSDGVSSALPITSIDLASSSQDEAQMESPCSDLNQPKLDEPEKSRQSCSSGNSSPFSPTTASNSSEPFEPDPPSNTSPISHSRKSPAESSPRSESAEDTPEWQLETEMYKGDLGLYSPGSFPWEDESDGEDMNEETMDCKAVSREDRHFVCPSTLRKLLAGTSQKAMIEEDDEDFVTPEVLCRQSLSLVYSTIDENYPEGTLQLLSDLLQPGYYPPRDITSHLLHGILLDLQSPHHLCVQAFKLLMRSQRHHMVDKNTVPWDWELLTSVMTDEEHTQRHRCDVVRMFLEYIVQTLEDDFRAKCSTSSLHHSIAKATLSCDQQFPRVREVIKWLFSAIMKSTEHGKGRETTQEREYMRMVSCLQRMLSLALEVDCSPALTSAKLSQELFHMLISNVPLRAHRMLLLESLQSKLLRCKLLEHLLDYACPVKISLPMSLSLLLHFLKHCTVAPDPMDGTEKWLKWEELVHLLWMLLLSYNKAMKGYLCNSLTEPRGRVGMSVYKPDDRVSRPAVQEAVEAFLSRSQADLDQALPLHVEESLTYLQDHLLDVCQC